MSDPNLFYGRFTEGREPESTLTIDDRLDFARDEIRAAQNLYRDDHKLQKKLRYEAVASAIEELERAQAMMLAEGLEIASQETSQSLALFSSAGCSLDEARAAMREREGRVS